MTVIRQKAYINFFQKSKHTIACLLVLASASLLFSEENNSPYFTTDWFSGNIEDWDKYASEFRDKPNKLFLEIGSWEGRSSLYIAEKFCNGKGSRLDCIDTWEGSREHEQEMSQLYERFLSNTESYRKNKKIVPHRGKSKDVLLDLNYKLKKGSIKKYNFIYIDGSHDAKDVMVDAVLAWELLDIGGIMIFDDYQWGSLNHLCPKLAIKGFLTSYMTLYEVLKKGYQVHIRKIRDIPIP